MRNRLLTSIVLLSLLAGCAERTPPIPEVAAGSVRIPITQSSYCWGKLGCADYAGGTTQLKGKQPTVVPPGASIVVSFAYKPAPARVTVQQFTDEKTANVPLADGQFQAPQEKGVYYYGLSAFWTTADGKHSKGDTSSVFVVEVR